MRAFSTIIVGALAGALAGYATTHFTRPPAVTNINAPVAGVGRLTEFSPARAKHIAAVTWPGLEQSEINAITATLKREPPGTLTIYCVSEAACGDLVLDLDNAFETAHWNTTLKTTPALLPGFVVSNDGLAQLIKGTVPSKFDVRVSAEAGDGPVISIGEKPKAR
jgi:hypothetical protein